MTVIGTEYEHPVYGDDIGAAIEADDIDAMCVMNGAGVPWDPEEPTRAAECGSFMALQKCADLGHFPTANTFMAAVESDRLDMLEWMLEFTPVPPGLEWVRSEAEILGKIGAVALLS